jgi:PKHD-type hydroxylase
MFEVRYWVWNKILSDELCDAIINEGDKLVSFDGRIGGIDNSFGGYDSKIRETNISFFESMHWIEGICLHFANIANFNAGWNFDIRQTQNIQYARYFPDQHYSPHRDDTVRRPMDLNNPHMMRKLSVAIQISPRENYTGGEFLIESNDCGELQSVPEFQDRGSVIVFPSVMKHTVSPIIKGVRHSVVSWIVGPNFR